MSEDRFQNLRHLEALLFAAAEPMSEKALAARLPEGTNVAELLAELATHYANRGVVLMAFEDRWAFRTAPDLSGLMTIERKVVRKMSRAAIETLAIVAYHQPVTRAEIEDIRGVVISKGTLDILLEAGWIRPAGRRETPGRPVTWATTDSFLEFFGLASCDALPGIEELRAAGLLDAAAGISSLGAIEGGNLTLPPASGADPEAEAAEAEAALELRGEAADDDYERDILARLEDHPKPA